MTISEFINEFKGDTTRAEVDEQGTTCIYHIGEDGKKLIASLRLRSNKWELTSNPAIMTPSVLDLMLKLARTPFEMRESRYVILNSKSHNQSWCYFTIGDQNKFLVNHNTTDPEALAQGAYTREALERQKRWLPERWRNAIDSMLTPLEVALEEGKDDGL